MFAPITTPKPPHALKARKAISYPSDDPHAERYRVWLEYVGEWLSGDPGDAPLEVWGKESR